MQCDILLEGLLKQLLIAMKRFLQPLILVLFLAPLSAFAQFCPSLGPDQILGCGESSATLFADMSDCSDGGEGVPLLTNTYTVSQIPFNPSPAQGTQVALTDDSNTGALNIGFNFCFFGNNYSQFYISSNGWIGFSPGQPTTFTSAPIPSTAFNVPKNCIMGPWQDWNPAVFGGPYIRYQTIGQAPCRKLVVSYTNIPFFSCTSTTGTFQIILNEGSNIIESHITNKQFCSWAGGTAVHGIHNAPGTAAVVVPGRNSTVWTATNQSWQWAPSGNPAPATYTWYEVGNPTPIATGPQSITVTPPAEGALYTCEVSYSGCYGLCNGGLSLEADTVFVSPGSGGLEVTLSTSAPVCFGECDASAEVTVSGGTPEYNYLWLPSGQNTPSVEELCAGEYTITVTDSENCTETISFEIVNPPQITIEGSINHN